MVNPWAKYCSQSGPCRWTFTFTHSPMLRIENMQVIACTLGWWIGLNRKWLNLYQMWMILSNGRSGQSMRKISLAIGSLSLNLHIYPFTNIETWEYVRNVSACTSGWWIGFSRKWKWMEIIYIHFSICLSFRIFDN